MSKMDILLQDGKTTYAPGETVRGRAQWTMEVTPRRLDLALFWYTTGKGTRDVGVIESIRFDDPGPHGTREFSFTLPEGPYSFSGKLISVVWAIELTCKPTEETARQEITVSPTGREIVLGEAPSQRTKVSPLESLIGSRR